jgi:hypothetical protein
MFHDDPINLCQGVLSVSNIQIQRFVLFSEYDIRSEKRNIIPQYMALLKS